MRGAVALLLLMWLSPGIACSPVLPDYVTFDKALSRPEEQPPAAPKVTVESMTWGRAADSKFGCPSPGILVLSIPLTPQSRALAYSFEMITGSAYDYPFQHGPSQGVEEGGKLWFRLPGLERFPDTQRPFNLVIRVTPFRRSGLAGEPTDVRVVDGGR